MGQVQTAISSYQTEYGVPPPGNDNASVVRALEGDNPRKIEFLTVKESDKNSKGEILDAWSFPLQITMTDPSHPLIRSIAPDKFVNIPDDLYNVPHGISGGANHP